ncbi:glutamate racemase [uncultured Campylobacter sp.]|uniref:glutamate racemase n=1 Tax=uncultured Campylobacter sp. TaxID=218934 RepID=UPI002609BC06|nr:glutamate racemase [uncultured Campylobacter sp.]
MNVGIFDSGAGGLSVLKSILNENLFENIFYYGDTARVPYGVKDKETIIKFSLEALDFFKQFKLDMLIIACNTVSAYALKELRKKADFPVLGVIDAGVNATKNALCNLNDEILVLATKATINSKQYENRLKKEGFVNVKSLATGLFVPVVEEGIFNGKIVQSLFEYYFKDISKQPEAIILGCTHFPLLSDALKEYFGKNTKLIHSGDAISYELKDKFKLKRLNKKPKIEFYASSDVKALKETAKLWLK